MLTCFQKTPMMFYNKKLADYCRKSTDESIRKLTDKLTLERNKFKNKNSLEEFNADNPNYNFYGFLAILSISTFAFYFYKRIE